MGDKLIIHNIDGTKTEVVPLKMWDPGEFQPYPESLITPGDFEPGSLDRARFCCKVRGYIARKAKPHVKYWKNTLDWKTLPERLSPEDRLALDWDDFDPADDEPASYLMA